MNAKQLEAQRKHDEAVRKAERNFSSGILRVNKERTEEILRGQRIINEAKDTWVKKWNGVHDDFDAALEQAAYELEQEWGNKDETCIG